LSKLDILKGSHFKVCYIARKTSEMFLIHMPLEPSKINNHKHLENFVSLITIIMHASEVFLHFILCEVELISQDECTRH
jgi:hypothetical protein